MEVVEKGQLVLVGSLNNYPLGVVIDNNPLTVSIGGETHKVKLGSLVPVAATGTVPWEIKELTFKEQSLLLYIETCAVDYGGHLDSRRINDEELNLLHKWQERGYIYLEHINVSDYNNIMVDLSEEAWLDAHRYRRVRYSRMKKKYIKKEVKNSNVSLVFNTNQFFSLSINNSRYLFKIASEPFRFREKDLRSLEGAKFLDLTENELKELFDNSKYINTER